MSLGEVQKMGGRMSQEEKKVQREAISLVCSFATQKMNVFSALFFSDGLFYVSEFDHVLNQNIF